MTVADLQRHLSDLARFLEAAGVKKDVPADLLAIQDALGAFRDVPLKTFAEFLKRAEAYSRGEVPVTAQKGRRTKQATPKPPPADPNDVARRLRAFYDGVADPSI